MLLRILPILLLLIIVPPIFLDRKLWRNRLKKKWRVMLFLPNVSLLIAAIALTCNETHTPINNTLIHLFLTLFLGYAATTAIFALFFAIGHACRRHLGLRNLIYAIGGLLALGNLYVVIVGTTYGKYHITSRHTLISSPSLPQSFDGYRIVQLSDLHLGSYGSNTRFVKQLTEMVNAEQADLIVFTGDLVNFNAQEVEPFVEELGKLRAQDGVVSILGNHDYLGYVKWETPEAQKQQIRNLCDAQRHMGWQLLLNQKRFVRRGNDSIAIIGVENDGKPPFPQRADLKKAQRGIPKKLSGEAFFKILLTHDPSHWRRNVLPETDIQLTLSGHTHGGQLRLWGIAPVKWFLKEWSGLYIEGARKLYVSSGLGEALFTFRYGIWPQYEVIILQKNSS